MAHHLFVVSGRESGQCFPLDQERMVLGRDPEADICLNALGASREHCVLRRSGDHIVIEDLGSRNGTKINGERIEGSVTLRTGDRITIGLTDVLLADDRNHGSVRIQVIEGAECGREIPLQGDSMSLGRGNQADIVLDDKGASRVNSRLLCERGLWFLEDCNSANGTRLNGDRIRGRYPLRSGDYFQVGSSVLNFIDGRIEDLAGSVLGQATLIRRIGSGSVGVVYQAKLQGTGQTVAVKVLDPALSQSPTEQARLQNALRNTQRIEHDHLITLIDSGIHRLDDAAQTPLFYVISDWAENGSLDDLLNETGSDLPPPMVVASLLLDAALGLHAAATNNLFHQGLRPGNLLIFRDGVGRVADFGITARYDASDNTGASYPYYVAPEELSGGTIDALSNQFSLGAIAYHALTGEPPFASDEIAASADARLTAALPNILSFNQSVPLPLIRVVARMMCRSREQRYPSWDALTADLQQVIEKGNQARIASVEGSVISQASYSETPQRSHAPRRGRGAGPRSYAVEKTSEAQQMRTVWAVAIAAVVLVGIFLFAMHSQSSGGDSRTTRSESAQPLRPHESQGQDAIVARRSELRQPSITPIPGAPRPREETEPMTPSLTPEPQSPTPTHRQTENVRSSVVTSAGPDIEPDQTAAQASLPTDPEVQSEQPQIDPAESQETIAQVPEQEADEPSSPTETPRATTIAQASTIPREGPLLHFARPNTWEDGEAILTDGRRKGSAFRVSGNTIEVRDAQGSVTAIPEAQVASLEHASINSPQIRRGNNLLDRRDFAGALEAYSSGQEHWGDEPYFKQQVARAQRMQERLENAQQQIVNGQLNNDGMTALQGLLAYIEIVQPRRLDPGYAEVWESIWPQVAGQLDSAQRESAMEEARQVGLRLHYDEQAPELLAQALQLSQASEPDHRQAQRLFQQAAQGNAYFDDQAYLAYARSLLATGDRRAATSSLQRVSSAGRNSDDYLTLSLSLGLRPPPLEPELLVSTYIGGRGNQSIRNITINNNVVVASGNNFQVAYQLSSLRGVVSGNIHHDEGDERYSNRPSIHPRQGTTFTDPRSGHTYHNRMRQVHAILQQPMLTSSAGWTMWGHNYADINPGTNSIRWGPLMADSRGYEVWAMPNGLIGASFWTDGGNSVLTRHPLDLTKSNPIEQMNPHQRHSSGMATLYLLIDPSGSEPRIVGGTFVPIHIINKAIDPWGRIYLPTGVRTENYVFGSNSGGGGLFVLGPDMLRPEINLRFGGSGSEQFGQIALHDNILVLGGRTQSRDIPLRNAVQESHGGGDWDAWLAIIRLWPQP